MAEQRNGQNVGKVIEVKGVVIDAVFPDELPEIFHALRLSVEGRDVIAEVQQHLGDDRVRAVAMDSTDGLARGIDVHDTGSPITVPVGDPTFRADGEDLLLAFSLPRGSYATSLLAEVTKDPGTVPEGDCP